MPYSFDSPKLKLNLKEPEKFGNLAAKLDQSQRRKLADYVIELVKIDDQSMEEWRGKANGYLDKIDADVNESQPQNREQQSGSGDDNPPSTALTMSAVIQFAARATGSILSEPDLCKASEPGGEPLAGWVSSQLRTGDPDWVVDTDPLCLHMAVTGLAWRKRRYDEHDGQYRSRFLGINQVIINANVTSTERAPRVTEDFERYPYEIVRSIELGHWVDYEPMFDELDPQAPQKFYETDMWLDLDGDGYDEPWTITVARDDTPEVVKIWPRWTKKTVVDTPEMLLFQPMRHFYPYKMLPDPKGTFFPKGFGWLLSRVEASADSLLASIDDTAKSAAENGGITSTGGVGMPDKIELKGNRLTAINTDGRPIADILSLFPAKQVTPGMFQSLDKVLTLGDRLAGTLNLLENAPASMTATLAKGIIDTGSQVQSAVHRRLVGAMTDEFRSFAGMADAMDKLPDGVDAKAPVACSADPTMATEMHRGAVAQVYQSMLGAPLIFDVKECGLRFCQTMRLPNPEKLIAQVPPPEPTAVEKADAFIKLQKNQIDKMKAKGQIILQIAQAVNALSQAGLNATNAQLVQVEIAKLNAAIEELNIDGSAQGQPGGGAGMATAPPDQGATQLPSSQAGPGGGGDIFGSGMQSGQAG